MPYFVFKIFPDDRLEHVETHKVFRDAMKLCRRMRADRPAGADYEVRMIFAEDIEAGRRLLRTRRSPPPLEEWEA